jgi:hypothetical protein
MELVIRTWHGSEKEIKGLASVGLKHEDIIKDQSWSNILMQVFEIYKIGLNVSLLHTTFHPDSIVVGVSDDLFQTR